MSSWTSAWLSPVIQNLHGTDGDHSNERDCNVPLFCNTTSCEWYRQCVCTVDRLWVALSETVKINVVIKNEVGSYKSCTSGVNINYPSPFFQLMSSLSLCTTFSRALSIHFKVVWVHERAYNIIAVNIGSSPDELLHNLQIALLSCHHKGSLSVLKGENKEIKSMFIEFKLGKQPLNWEGKVGRSIKTATFRTFLHTRESIRDELQS